MFWWWYNNSINLNPEYLEEVDSDEFIRIYRTEPDNIDWATVVPAKLGHGFGKILIRRKNPLFKYMKRPIGVAEEYESIAG